MSDIKTYGVGAGSGVGFYWIKEYAGVGVGRCLLVAIDEYGNVTRTKVGKELDEAAPSESEAVHEHISGGIKAADAHLERRRKKLAENPPEDKPEPMDPATQRFFWDWD